MASTLLSRRSLIVGAIGTLGPSRAIAAAPALTFLVIGDWGQRCPEQNAVAHAMALVAQSMDSDFVISTGDNFYRHGVRTSQDPQWRDTFEEVYASPSLQTPWYAVLGNHDYEGEPAAEVEYTSRSARWKMPARYWRQDMPIEGEMASLFFLDTTPIARLENITEHAPLVGLSGEAHQQLRWLETELSACTSKWKIAIGHHPIISGGTHGSTPAMILHVRPLFERYGVNVYFHGHDHDLEHLSANGVNYVCSGAGSEARPTHAISETLFARSGLGFAACQLTSEALALRFYDGQARMTYETAIKRT